MGNAISTLFQACRPDRGQRPVSDFTLIRDKIFSTEPRFLGEIRRKIRSPSIPSGCIPPRGCCCSLKMCFRLCDATSVPGEGLGAYFLVTSLNCFCVYVLGARPPPPFPHSHPVTVGSLLIARTTPARRSCLTVPI